MNGSVGFRNCCNSHLSIGLIWRLTQTITRLYRQSGIKQGSSHSGRRSLAVKVLAATGDVETVQTTIMRASTTPVPDTGSSNDPASI